MRFIYYVPGHVGGTFPKQKLFEIGLGHIAGKADPMVAVQPGPDGKTGAFVYAPALPGQGDPFHGYDVEQQEWREWKGFWIGWTKSAAPTPGDLKRETEVPGQKVVLADGNEWIIPCARVDSELFSLPASVELDPKTDQLVARPASRFSAIVAMTEELFNLIYIDTLKLAMSTEASVVEGWPEDLREMVKGKGMTFRQGFDAVVEILSVNYRIGAAEVSALKLIEVEHIRNVTHAICDFDGFVKLLDQKKKASASAG